MNKLHLKNLCKLIRYDILTSTTNAGSGHPTTSLSAVELIVTLFFGGPPAGGFFRYDLENPHYILNDRVIFSKGHAAPLLYSLYHAAGVITYEKLMTLRKFNSVLEGHPTPRWPYVDVASGSLGQGLSVGIGMALGIKLKIRQQQLKMKREPKVFVLLGDSETAEGQVWEALQLASYYQLNNLVGILDVNRLGQRGETMLGWDINTYEKRIASFGWKVIVVDNGHDLEKIHNTFEQIEINPTNQSSNQPIMIIAKTVKGKGVSFLENKDNWHGKAVPKDMLASALKELGEIDLDIRGKIQPPPKPGLKIENQIENVKLKNLPYKIGDMVSTREAYGDALVMLGKNEDIVVLDAETSNSTYAEKFKKVYPDRFFEMFIAEQNMISVALGISKIGYVPFISSFAAFLSRAFDQMRIAQYSHPNVKITGSHAGVSIGEDGPSQMALEDIAMARSLLESVVLYPSDATSTVKLVEQMYDQKGMIFLRTTREKTPVIYDSNEKFEIGSLKILKQSAKDKTVVITAGITLHEALKAYNALQKENINITVVDLYSVKPLDKKTLKTLAKKVKHFIVVEDHYPYGGIGEAIKSTLANEGVKIHHLAVHKISPSGKPSELLRYEEIDAEEIVKKIKEI